MGKRLHLLNTDLFTEQHSSETRRKTISSRSGKIWNQIYPIGRLWKATRSIWRCWPCRRHCWPLLCPRFPPATFLSFIDKIHSCVLAWALWIHAWACDHPFSLHFCCSHPHPHWPTTSTCKLQIVFQHPTCMLLLWVGIRPPSPPATSESPWCLDCAPLWRLSHPVTVSLWTPFSSTWPWGHWGPYLQP